MLRDTKSKRGKKERKNMEEKMIKKRKKTEKQIKFNF